MCEVAVRPIRQTLGLVEISTVSGASKCAQRESVLAVGLKCPLNLSKRMFCSVDQTATKTVSLLSKPGSLVCNVSVNAHR